MSPGPLPQATSPVPGTVEPDNGKFSACALSLAGTCTAAQMAAIIYNINNWTYSNTVFPAGTSSSLCTYNILSNNTAGAPSSNPTVCVNTVLSPNITIATTVATGIGAPTGLPAGVTASFSANTITISGTPTTTVGSPFNYSIPLTGGCGTVNATGTITVRPNNTVGASSTNPTVCVNTAISPNITIATTGATGIGAPTGLPAGVTASFGANTITISGTPTTAVGSPFNYSIPLTGGCGSVNATGTITVTAGASITSNPSASTACSGLAVSFTGAASNQTSLAWQESADIGFTTPTTLTNTGIYSNTSTATLNISDNSGVSGRYYRLVGINSNGCANANSTGALLTATAPTLPGTTSATNTIGTNNNLSYTASCGIVSKVVPLAGTPVSGIVTSNVWVEGAVPTYGGTPFVQRHYQITPAAGSTGTVTLYFSQKEFNNFNAVSLVDLPTFSGDAAGKANLRISKLNGSSSGGGLPGSYSSGGSLIDPADANIIFNAALSRWEVTFDVSGFSGFFVQTALSVLPVNLISFSAQKENNDVKLKWQTADEVNNMGFHVERQQPMGAKWDILSFVNAKGKNASYDFTDNTPLRINYYRLRQIDNDGKETLSKVVSVSMHSKGSLKVYPNPVSNVLTIETIRTDDYQIFNLLGQQVLYGKTMQQIDVSVLPQGAYMIKVGTEQVRFVKQ
jgi:hypothetical protein